MTLLLGIGPGVSYSRGSRLRCRRRPVPASAVRAAPSFISYVSLKISGSHRAHRVAPESRPVMIARKRTRRRIAGAHRASQPHWCSEPGHGVVANGSGAPGPRDPMKSEGNDRDAKTPAVEIDLRAAADNSGILMLSHRRESVVDLVLRLALQTRERFAPPNQCSGLISPAR